MYKDEVMYVLGISMETVSKDADGLIDFLNSGLQILGVENLCHKELVANQLVIVGGGTDGTYVNIAEQNRMNGSCRKNFLGCGILYTS